MQSTNTRYVVQRSDGGGVFYDLDSMNGQRLCGCNTIAACQVCHKTEFTCLKSIDNFSSDYQLSHLRAYGSPIMMGFGWFSSKASISSKTGQFLIMT